MNCNKRKRKIQYKFFSLSDFAKQKTKVTQEFFERLGGAGGQEKLFCKKVFFPPCNTAHYHSKCERESIKVSR